MQPEALNVVDVNPVFFQMLTDSAIPGSRIKIVTENGIVYMLGLVTKQEAARATNLVQGVSGVQKIVKLFEYID